MSRFRVAVDIDEAALVERCLAYVSDPRPDRRRHRELFELLDVLGRYGLGPPRELLELLAVEGVVSRGDVAAMVSAWLAEAAPPDETGPTGGAGAQVPPTGTLYGASEERRAVQVTAGAGPPEVHRLTRREADVLRLVATGQTNRQIAAALGLSPHTVKRHVHRILLKLDLPSRAAAAAFAPRAGLA